MSDPTAAQIEADVTAPTYECQVHTGSWSSVAADVVRQAHIVEATDGLAGFAFGVSRGATATVEIDAAAFDIDWPGTPIRLGYGFATSSKLVRFVGIITGRDRGPDDGTWACRGVDARIEGEKLWSPLLVGRPLATATTLTSIEDPSDGSYQGGPFNWICWQCGGRPYEQAATYPSADFYYRAERAILGPAYWWLSGENPWEELGRLARVCGGQIYQDDEGTLRYVGPTALATGTPSFTYTDTPLSAAQRVSTSASHYESHRESAELSQNVTLVTCTYVGRRVQGYQQIYEETEPLLIPGGETVAITMDTQLPIFDPARVRLEVEAAVLRTAARASTAQLTATITARAATRFVAALENTLSEPITVYVRRLYGRPVSAGEEGSASYSAAGDLNTTRKLEIPDSPLIQTRSHAERLCRMVWDFASGERGLLQLAGCGYDPRRYVGEPVAFTSARWGETATACRIVAIRPTGDGFMDVDLGRAEGLPVDSDFYEIRSTVYPNETVLQLTY